MALAPNLPKLGKAMAFRRNSFKTKRALAGTNTLYMMSLEKGLINPFLRKSVF
jgi:hypothetical protein